MKPFVSIIIPTYNRAHLIRETLDSILVQTFENWECIIVDDGSIDNTNEIVEKFVVNDSRFQYYHRPSESPKGANSCRNYGFEMSKGKYINWFDSDDIMDSSFVQLKVLELEKETKIDAVISKTIMFRDNITNIVGKENRTFLSENTLQDFLKLNIAWYLPDVMWRRSFLVNKIIFDDELFAGQDRDFHARMLLHNPRLKVIDKYLTYYRLHVDNITLKLDNRQNPVFKISHLYSIVKLTELLSEAGVLSKSLKVFFFKSMMKYLPFVINDKSDLKVLFKLMKSLSFVNLEIIINWVKIFFAYISFKLFGKGEKFLK
ncbi:MAG: glycosyltransferase [Flavobacterium sp.]|uniref:glycosyltransferase family 2 protein n=1 Tax=Flavobacterium sp. TaxID=239 RepID=UPI0026040BA1|nr:glycosyltransferase [Flavobacterium sp.]MDD5152038.1 glycosyltransferase [Flavobacterium sp.]